MISPFKVAQKVTQVFGNKLFLNGVDYYAQFGLKGHDGVDYGCPTGTDLVAPIDGVITIKDYGKKAYGLHIVITKNTIEGSTEVLLGHLTWARGKNGDTVKAGDVIATSGGDKSSPTSGTSTGAHLHLGLRFRNLKGEVINKSNGFSGWVDSLLYIK